MCKNQFPLQDENEIRSGKILRIEIRTIVSARPILSLENLEKF
jgi:hypothetical protein